MKYSAVLALVLSLTAMGVDARPTRRATALDIQNGQAAVALNNQFKTMKAGQSCTTGQQGCINGGFALCANGKMVSEGCAAGTTCAALPVVGGQGTAIACTTQADIDARLAASGASSASSASASASGAAATSSKGSSAATSSQGSTATTSITSTASAAAASGADNSGQGGATGNNGGNATAASANSKDPQTSTQLDPSVIATGFEQDGQGVPAAGQVASLVSGNNFINFCATVKNMPITNGQQVKTGSCNPAPMGVIAATTKMPSAKFVFPQNMGTVPAKQNFTIQMAIKNLDTGNFVNAEANYFAAPQQTNSDGLIVGHSHVVIEKLDSLTQTTATNPGTFQFFKGLNDPAQNGVLEATVTGGLPAGVYRLASINSAANHQPVLVAVAQHGSLDDMIYFTAK